MPNVIREMVKAEMIGHEQVIALASEYLGENNHPRPPCSLMSVGPDKKVERRRFISAVNNATRLGLLRETEHPQLGIMHELNLWWVPRIAAYVEHNKKQKNDLKNE